MKDKIIALLKKCGFDMSAYEGADAKELKLTTEMVEKLEGIDAENETLKAEAATAATAQAEATTKIADLEAQLAAKDAEIKPLKDFHAAVVPAIAQAVKDAGIKPEASATPAETIAAIGTLAKEQKTKLATTLTETEIIVDDEEDGGQGEKPEVDAYMKRTLQKYGVK